MNNANISLQYEAPEDDLIPKLRAEESRLTKLLEAIRGLKKSNEWRILTEMLFEALPNTLERTLMEEAKKEVPDTQKLNRLSGQLEWAEKYADLSKLEGKYHVQLQSIKQQLNANTPS